jgi:hypothetical protein
MGVRATGKEFKSFYEDKRWWPEGVWHDEEEIYIDGVMVRCDFELCGAGDESLVLIKGGYVATDGGKNLGTLADYFRKWRHDQKVASGVIVVSGGAFGYVSYKVMSFAEEMREEMNHNEDEEMASSRHGIKSGAFLSKETMARMERAYEVIEKAGRLANKVEWLYSDDITEERFCEVVDEIIGCVEFVG